MKNPRFDAAKPGAEATVVTSSTSGNEFCSGTAHLVTPDLAGDFLQAAVKVRKIEPKHFFVY